MQEARYYHHHESGVICKLCPKECIISPEKTGFCRVRKNIGNKLYTQNYAACSSYAIDPIEKKPLYHFYPGSHILSLGTWGCNFNCKFCQNWEIAQDMPEVMQLQPDEAAHLAVEQQQHGNIGIAYTYSEPSVWYEYILDTAKVVSSKGLKNVLVSNGFINTAPLEELLPYIDAMNIDIKAFNNEFYKKVCGGELSHVKQTVKTAASKCHVEITTLVIPGLNDDKNEITALVEWLADIDPNIPIHFSRYFPNYKMDLPPTPYNTLKMVYETAVKYLRYVYIGNVGDMGLNTFCYNCGQLVLDRQKLIINLTAENKCCKCGSSISIIGEVMF